MPPLLPLPPLPLLPSPSFTTSTTASAYRLPLDRLGPAPIAIGTVAAGAAATIKVRRTSEGGNDSGNVRGLTTTMADARISPMSNSWRTRGTLLLPPSLGILQGAPPSRRGGEEKEEEEEEAPLAPPAGCRDASR